MKKTESFIISYSSCETRHVTAVNRFFFLFFKLSGCSVIILFLQVHCVPRTVQNQPIRIQVHHLIWHRDVMHCGLLLVHKVHIRDPDILHDFCVKFYDVNTVRFVVPQAFVYPTLSEVEWHRVILWKQVDLFLIMHEMKKKILRIINMYFNLQRLVTLRIHTYSMYLVAPSIVVDWWSTMSRHFFFKKFC